jgi:methyl-accepting chemotaxis protein
MAAENPTTGVIGNARNLEGIALVHITVIGQQQAIGSLDSITQQNAALVEESAAASDSLKQQAERLVEAVSVFR